jgi:hypothetical protein
MPSYYTCSRLCPDGTNAALLCAGLIVIAALLFFQNNVCEAGYLSAFVGNTKGDTNPSNGRWTVNFAVLDRLSGPSTAGDLFGTGLSGFDGLEVSGGGSPSFDTSARYLYLYQFVESPTSNFYLVAAGVMVDPLPITSYEQWNLFLADNSGNTSTSNDFGTDGVSFLMSPPANIGVTDPHVSASGDTASLIGATFTQTPTSFLGSFNSNVDPGEMSNLWGVTSNAAPRFYFSPSAEFAAGATIPIPSPEPSTFALLSLAILAIGGLRFLRP